MRLLTGVTLLLAVLAIAESHDIEKRQARRRARPGAKRRTPGKNALSRLSDPTPAGKRVVCYYTNWSVYRKGIGKFLPSNINPYLCTHLMYAFAGLTDEFEMTMFDEYQDIEKGGYSQFNALKQYNKNLRTLIAIGGWEEGSARFSELVSFPEYREVFINSTLRHIRRHGFDGLDLDWEYPASRPGSMPEDKDNYALLVHELRVAFEKEAEKSFKPRLLLTMAVPAGQNYIDKGYDIPSLNRNLDFFNILNYDYHVSLDPVVRNHAALLPMPGTSEYEDTYKLNVDWTVKYYIELGADKKKLVIGIPTYGRSFKLADAAFSEYGSSGIGPAEAGRYTKQKGFLGFYEVCELMAMDNWKAEKPFPRIMGPYAHLGDQWVGYDDEGIAATKGEYVRDTGLGGIMYWSLDTDDFRGICNGQQYLLIEAGKAALLSEPSGNALDKRGPSVSPLVLPVTPVPPTTPSPIPVIDCKREGFFPNPENCHQYFWCLEAGAAGIVAHTFTCPAGLVFSKSVGGCEHADRAKCKEGKNRGGANADKKKIQIPTTTPLPEFDYDYYYYYDDADYEDDEDFPTADAAPAKLTPAKKEPAKKEPAKIDAPPRTSSRNSGGSQFSRPAAAEATPSSKNKDRSRPQYSSISRDRPQPSAADQEPSDAAVESSAPGGSNARRPQYTSIQRNRPSTEAPPPDSESGVTPSSGLNYVTIERRRQSTSEDNLQVADFETSTQAGLQYVTLRRSSNRGTTPSPSADDDSTKLIAVDSDSFRKRPERVETTTELTTTTTPRPARIVVPKSFFKPVTPSVVHLLNLDPRRSRPQQRKDASEITERVRRPSSARTSTESPTKEVISDAFLDEYYYDYEDPIVGVPDPIPTTEGAIELEAETTLAPVIPVKEVIQSVIDDNLVEENAVISVRPEVKENVLGVISESTTSRTTINLLADFPALITTVFPDTSVVKNDDTEARKAFKPAREDIVIPEVTTQQAPEEEEAPVTQQQRTVAPPRRIPKLPKRPKVPVPIIDGSQQTDRKRPVLPPRPISRFPRPGSDSDDSSKIETVTRRSSFRPTNRDQLDDRTQKRPATQNRFRPRTDSQPIKEVVEKKPFESSVSRFRNRPIAHNPFRLNPVAVTTAAPFFPPRPRRPRPTSNRKRPRPHTIKFRTPVTVTEPPPEVTEQPTDAEDVTNVDGVVVESEQPVTPNDLFAAIFGGNDEAVSDISPLVGHRILDTEKPEVIADKKSLSVSSSPSPVTESLINFDDFFTPTTTPRERFEEITTAITTTTTTTRRPRTPKPTTIPTTTTTRRPRLRTAPPTAATTTTTSTTAPSRGLPARSGPRVSPRVPEPFTKTKRPLVSRGDGRPPPGSRSSTWRPPTQIADYVYDDYFYDDTSGALGGTLGELAELTEKALLLPGGKVQCYDTGYFAHPESCKKFISCSKTVRGAVRGYVYTCPQNLVFDPVGGMCNWAETVDCQAPII